MEFREFQAIKQFFDYCAQIVGKALHSIEEIN